MLPRLTIVIINYNSADFIRVTLKSLFYLTKNPFKVLILDNGSSQKERIKIASLCKHYQNVELEYRRQSQVGSFGHGEALNIATQKIDTEYGVILDADCIPLIRNWDELLIKKMTEDATKIIGTPVAHNAPNNTKPIDFPLIFLCLFETATFKQLDIDLRPNDLSLNQDTGWELREKYQNAGLKGSCLQGENTRFFKDGPFATTICEEYYLDTALFCCHFGRGSNSNSPKYIRSKWLRPFKKWHFHHVKKQWLSVCENYLFTEIHRSLSSDPHPQFNSVNCSFCHSTHYHFVRSGYDFINTTSGEWDVVQCAQCNLVFQNPRLTDNHLASLYDENYDCFQNQETEEGLKPTYSLFKKQVLRQHFNYFSDKMQPSPFWKALTYPFKLREDIDLIPTKPNKISPKLLEIGCATGTNLMKMRHLGWDISGIELSEHAVTIAQKRGLPVTQQKVEEIGPGSDTFDAIVMSMVLEHTQSPINTLKKLHTLLSPHGELLLSVPDFSGIESRLFKSYFYGLMLPFHLHHFTPNTLGAHLTAAGFRYTITHHYFHRDIKASMEFYGIDHPDSIWPKIFRKVPTVLYKILVLSYALFGKSSRMSIRATKAT